jgi:ectoine hydroxylase-related dioxygenase (phytanoyl-CoA dioxygenase family)
MLTAEQLRHYSEYGFVKAENILPDDFLIELRSRVDEYALKRRPLTQEMHLTHQYRHWCVFRETISIRIPLVSPYTLRKIANLQHDDLFRALMFNSRVLDPVEQILGPDIKLQRIDAFYKAPRFGWAIGVHQDAVYWPLAPIDTPDSICNVFCFLDDATENNGCLGFLPRRHREGPLPAQWVDADTKGERHVLPAIYSDAEKVWVPCKAGDAVFFHGMTPHFSGRNRSSKFRRAISISCLSAKLRHTRFTRDIDGHDGPGYEREYIQLRGRSFPECI